MHKNNNNIQTKMVMRNKITSKYDLGIFTTLIIVQLEASSRRASRAEPNQPLPGTPSDSAIDFSPGKSHQYVF